MPKIEQLAENIMMIFGNTQDGASIYRKYMLNVKEINYGGIIKKAGSKQYSNAIFLTEKETEDAARLKDHGDHTVYATGTNLQERGFEYNDLKRKEFTLCCFNRLP